ncbi:MAG: hypothetical protein HOQ05_10380 [Corynebacteriales bacterium]|nr:hypothetical protein [Mycobacteriales bacterium]
MAKKPKRKNRGKDAQPPPPPKTEPENEPIEEEDELEPDIEDDLSGIFDGVITRSTSAWQRTSSGSNVRVWDVRLRYFAPGGPRNAQSFLPSHRYLPPGTEIVVERSRGGTLRIIPREQLEKPEPEPGTAWSRPDVKTGLIGLIILFGIVAVVLIVSFLYIRSSINKLPGEFPSPPTQGPTSEPASPTP